MAINKVEFGDQTLMDLTGDTVTPEDVLNGATFHDRAGVSRSGTASYPVTDVQVNNTSVLDGTVAKITQGTAATKDVPASGNASTSQVVMGNDTRLTDSRNANDVYAWAKASTKPSYTASEVGAIATTAKGAANGVAELDANGKVPSSQLPSYVDDVVEGYYNDQTDRFYEESTFVTVITPESGKSWVDVSTNKSYRWTGSVYVRVDEGVQLGETSDTAYRGDRGKTAYDHSQLTSGNPHNVTKSDVGLGNVGNFKAVSTVASQGLTDTEKSNARANIGAGTSNLTIGTTSTTAAAGDHTHGVVSTSANGFAPKITDTGKFLKGDGTWSTPANTTYTFANGTNGFTVTPSGGTAQTVTVTPSIANNITGSGTSGYIAKFNGANTITNGPAFGSATTTYLRNDGTWATPPDNDTKNTAGSTDTSSKIFLIGATSQAANPQTYSDDQVYVTSGTLQANVVSATAGINANTANSGAAGGVSLYSNNPAGYGITMRNTGTSTGQLGKHGYVRGDWAGYLCFSGATNRGYIFRQAGSNVASVSGEGHAVFNGSVTIGGNAANTSGARMQYNSTNQCIDFVFV